MPVPVVLSGVAPVRRPEVVRARLRLPACPSPTLSGGPVAYPAGRVDADPRTVRPLICPEPILTAGA